MSIKRWLLLICIATLLFALYLVLTTPPLSAINLLLICLGAIGALKVFTK